MFQIHSFVGHRDHFGVALHGEEIQDDARQEVAEADAGIPPVLTTGGNPLLKVFRTNNFIGFNP